MIRFHCLERLPDGTSDSGIELLNAARWHINSDKSRNGMIVVRTGETALITTDEPAVAEAFLVGMALVLNDFPKDLFDEYRRRMLLLEGPTPDPNDR
jgi:hypothetical protein